MLGLSPWISLLAVLLATAAARLLPPRELSAVRQALDSRWAPVVAGAGGGLLTVWLWGSLHEAPVIHDEAAYLLQAELFARFRWTEAGPALPQFFEQLHVLVRGVLASKYPPGNSLLLAAGALVGAPGLSVVVMNACATALIFLLARRFAGSVVALLTLLVWQSSFPMLYYHANYMSEGVTSVTWLVTWWAVLQWRDGAGTRWLVCAAVAVAWTLITRPFTGLALGFVALLVVIRHCRTNVRWRGLAPALAAAAAVMALIPLWNWRTTGSALTTPLGVYERMYSPFDKPGFGVRPEDRPTALLPHDQWMTSAAFYQEHARHTVAALPRIAAERLTMIDRDAWYEWRGGLRAFALVGLIALSAEVWIGLAAFAMQFLLYLGFAHPAWWTIYYLEAMPLPAFLTALGIVRAARVLGGEGRLREDAEAGARTLTASLLVALPLLGAVALVSRQVRSKIREDHGYLDAFARLERQIPDPRAIVFVRYSEKHPDGLSLVRNVADPQAARVWTVYDRGTENARLMAIAPERAAYRFDESSWTLSPIPRAAMPNAPSIAIGAADSVRVRGAARRRR